MTNQALTIRSSVSWILWAFFQCRGYF